MLVFAPAPLALLSRIPAGAAPWLVTAAAAWWEWRRPSRAATREARAARANAAPLPRLDLWTAACVRPLLLVLVALQLVQGVRIS
jgi:hypothetical protein